MSFFSKIKKELKRFGRKVEKEVKRVPGNVKKYAPVAGAALQFIPGLGTLAGTALGAVAKSSAVAKVVDSVRGASSAVSRVRNIASAYQQATSGGSVGHHGMVLPNDHPAMTQFPGRVPYTGLGRSNIATNTARLASKAEERAKRERAVKDGETHELPGGRVKVWLERVDAFLNLRGRDYD